MTEQNRPFLPIGYWLKKPDELLTTRINEAQEANGLSRTEWQILNVLSETSSATKSEIIEALRPFGDERTLGSPIESLIDRGLVEKDGTEANKLRLTAQGKTLHASAHEVQAKVRHRAIQGISEADFVTTVKVLQQIVSNLSDEKD